jgi:hypothetical protein
MMTSTSGLPADLIDQMKAKKIWQIDCPVALDRLSVVNIKYVDFDGAVHEDGELVEFDAVAPRVHRIFERLFELGFPIAQIRSLHHFDGDDDKSMAANNSSAFNFRPIEGTNTVSMHGYGLAIDVNPLQNPFITFNEMDGIATVHPPAGWQYLNRHNQKPGMVESIAPVFAENGFVIWGGNWTTPIDYHHFQPPRLVAELLSVMNREDGTRFFDYCADNHDTLVEKLEAWNATELVALYCSDPKLLFEKLFSKRI